MDAFQVNKKLLPVKVHYFLLNGAHSGVITFIPVYAEQLGISSSAIGIILAALSCLTVVSKATFGGIVDHFQRLKQILLLLIVVDVVADLGLNFIPRPYQKPLNVSNRECLCYSEHLHFINRSYPLSVKNSTDDYSISCSLCEDLLIFCCIKNKSEFRTNYLDFSEFTNVTINNTSDPSNIFLKKCLSEKCFGGSIYPKEKATNSPLQLVLLSLFVGLIYMANGSIVSLSDAACYNSLGDKPQHFGKQRLWGTIGWGSFAFFTGYLNQVFTGSSNIYSFSAGFYMLVVLFMIDVFVIIKLPLKQANVSNNIFKDVRKLLVKPRITLFIFGIFGIGIVTGISRCYLYWYLRTTLEANQLALGCISGIQCFFGELPFFFFSGLIIRKLGYINTFTMSFLSYGLRFLIHSFMTNPWLALPVELLQGPCFGSFYSAMTSYSKIIAPEGTEATMQGIVSGTFEGLGVATGSLLVGFCFSSFGNRTTFFWVGIISLLVGVIHWVIHFIMDCYKSDAEKSREKCHNTL